MNHFYESAFKHMPTPAFVLESSSGKLISFNHNFGALFKKFNVEPETTWNALSVDSNDWNTLYKKIESGEIKRCESAIKVGNKHINMQLEFQNLNETVLVCAYNADNMDLSSAENTLLKFALTESSAGMWIWETEPDIVSCSNSIATILGCSLEQTPTSAIEWFDRVHPDDITRLSALVNAHLQEKDSHYEVDYRIRKSDQTYLWVKERARTYSKDTNGNIKKTLGFIVDISHQKALEEHLRNQATFDELTGLLTRSAAITHFKKQLGLAKRQYTPLTMAKIHLDMNQRLQGLPMEERNIAIQTSARHIYKKMRESDILARVESDKLLLLLPNTSVKDAENLLTQMINPTKAEEVTIKQGNADPMDLCIGLAVFPEDGEDIEELAASANQAVEKGQRTKQKIILN